MVRFINLTQHSINVVRDGSVVLSIPPSGTVARVATFQTVVCQLDGIDVVRTVFGDIVGLPDPQDGVVYVVSTLVLQALKASGVDRSDVVAPDTSPASVVRDDVGQIVGVKRFQVL